jgi:hypothetical protein
MPAKKKDVSSSRDFTRPPWSRRPSPRIAFSLEACELRAVSEEVRWKIENEYGDQSTFMQNEWNFLRLGPGLGKKGDFFSKGRRRNLNLRTEIIKNDV